MLHCFYFAFTYVQSTHTLKVGGTLGVFSNGEWRRLHNEELQSLYHSPNIVRVIKSTRLGCPGHVVRMGEGRSILKILTSKPTGNRTLGRPRHRWEDNIRIVLKEMGINTRNWVDLAQDRDYWRVLLNVALELQVP